MSFNTALTGLRAATSDLNVTGNNIANSSTSGFKQSRVEFADVYANSVTGGGTNAIGNGVRVADISQSFSQGNISFTQNSLDMAINGGGFFVINDQGVQAYTRAGQFGVDNQGFIVANSGARLQGFPATPGGTLSGILGDLQLSTSDIAPRQTTNIDLGLNIDGNGTVLEDIVFQGGSSLLTTQQAIAGTSNGYAQGSVVVDGVTHDVPSLANLSAALIAGEFSAISGVTATASTEARFSYAPAGAIGPNELEINRNPIVGTDLTTVLNEINSLSGITASLDAVTGEIVVIEESGIDLVFEANAPLAVTLMGANGGTQLVGNGGGPVALVGGEIDITFDDGVNMTALNILNSPPDLNVFDLDPITGLPAPPATQLVVSNEFDPANPNTYNDATSLTVFDSLGGPHDLRLFFVKQSANLTAPNTWSVYAQIDGQDIGEPSPLNPGVATQAEYQVRFFNDGSLDQVNSDDLLISNWTVLDADGTRSGSLPPRNLANGGSTDVADPPTSSNFLIDLSGTTQFKSDFAVNEVEQDGFSSGRLAGLDISESGIIFARYSNGEALVLAQVALADFANQEGLTPLGNTAWAESFESGAPVVGAPRTSSLGAITSGALEDSNVELAEELVALIVAQRNFQANSRIIETANEIQQTIINIR